MAIKSKFLETGADQIQRIDFDKFVPISLPLNRKEGLAEARPSSVSEMNQATRSQLSVRAAPFSVRWTVRPGSPNPYRCSGSDRSDD